MSNDLQTALIALIGALTALVGGMVFKRRSDYRHKMEESVTEIRDAGTTPTAAQLQMMADAKERIDELERRVISAIDNTRHSVNTSIHNTRLEILAAMRERDT